MQTTSSSSTSDSVIMGHSAVVFFWQTCIHKIYLKSSNNVRIHRSFNFPNIYSLECETSVPKNLTLLNCKGHLIQVFKFVSIMISYSVFQIQYLNAAINFFEIIQKPFFHGTNNNNILMKISHRKNWKFIFKSERFLVSNWWHVTSRLKNIQMSTYVNFALYLTIPLREHWNPISKTHLIENDNRRTKSCRIKRLI